MNFCASDSGLTHLFHPGQESVMCDCHSVGHT